MTKINYLIFILLLCTALPVVASTQIITGGSENTANVNTYYSPMGFVGQLSGTTYTHFGIIPTAGTIKNFYYNVNLSPGAGTSFTMTLIKNGSATALTCTISDTNTSCNDTSNTVSVVAGDEVYFSLTKSGSPAARRHKFGYAFEATNSAESIFLPTVDYLTQSGTGYFPLSGGTYLTTATLADTEVIIPTAGTFSKLYIKLAQAPGSGKSWVLTVMKNTSNTALTCTISNTATTCNDISNSFTVAAGDKVTIKFVGSGTPVLDALFTGLLFTADTAGEFVIAGINATGDYDVDLYYTLEGGYHLAVDSATEADVSNPTPAFTAKKIYIEQNPAPGGSGSRVYSLRDDGSTTALTCTITGASTACNGSATTSVQVGSLLSVFSQEAVEAAAATRVLRSILGYNASTTLPKANLTGQWDSSVIDRLYQSWQAGTPYYNTPVTANSDPVDVWIHEQGTVDRRLVGTAGTTRGTWNSTGINSIGAVAFDGTNDVIFGYNDARTVLTNTGSYISASAFTAFASIRITGDCSNEAAAYDNDSIWSDTLGYVGIHCKTSGGTTSILAYNYDTNEDSVSINISQNTDYVVMVRHEGGNLYLSVNDGTESSVASGNTNNSAAIGTFVVGRSGFKATNFTPVRIGEIAMYNTALTGSTFNDAMDYFTGKWLVNVVAPTVTSSTASSVTSSTATLNGNITATGGADATQHGFAYGTDSMLVSVIATSTLGSYSGTGAFNAGVSSLSANTTYYFRAYATNTGGTGYGSTQSFTTSVAGSTRIIRLKGGTRLRGIRLR